MQLMFLKLKNGEEIVSYILQEDDNFLKLQSPLQIQLSAEHGFLAKEWLFLSEPKDILLSKENIMFISLASQKAISYYEGFYSRFRDDESHFQEDRNSFDDADSINELEDLFTALLESKHSIKH